MTMIIHEKSHADHAITHDQWVYIVTQFGDRSAFFIETIELPEALGTVMNGLYGPSCGDAPVLESEVYYAPRGVRAWDSRMTKMPARPTRFVRVVAGPYEEKCSKCAGTGVGHSLSFQVQFGNPNYTCLMCNGTKVLKHPCILYTAYGVMSKDMPAAPKEPSDIFARLWAQSEVEAVILSYQTLLDTSAPKMAQEHAEDKVLAWQALEKEYEVARVFWNQHALASEVA